MIPPLCQRPAKGWGTPLVFVGTNPRASSVSKAKRDCKKVFEKSANEFLNWEKLIFNMRVPVNRIKGAARTRKRQGTAHPKHHKFLGAGNQVEKLCLTYP